MTPTEFIQGCIRRGIALRVDDTGEEPAIKVKFPPGFTVADSFVPYLKKHKATIIEALSNPQGSEHVPQVVTETVAAAAVPTVPPAPPMPLVPPITDNLSAVVASVPAGSSPFDDELTDELRELGFISDQALSKLEEEAVEESSVPVSPISFDPLMEQAERMDEILYSEMHRVEEAHQRALEFALPSTPAFSTGKGSFVADVNMYMLWLVRAASDSRSGLWDHIHARNRALRTGQGSAEGCTQKARWSLSRIEGLIMDLAAINDWYDALPTTTPISMSISTDSPTGNPSHTLRTSRTHQYDAFSQRAADMNAPIDSTTGTIAASLTTYPESLPPCESSSLLTMPT